MPKPAGPGRKLTLFFETPLHHGSGYGLAGLIDRPFLRDATRMPYLSAAAIKGKFRWAAYRNLKTQDFDGLCVQQSGSFCRSEPCRLCELFGSPWHPGRAVFSEAYPSPEQRAILRLAMSDRRTTGTNVRTGTGIDRSRRVVRHDHLYNTEVAPALTFESYIEGTLREDQWALLTQCALVLTHFGAGSARGLGRCRFGIESPEGEP